MLVPERSPLADAIRYALGHWTALTRFLDDGRIELDTNPVERAIRRSLSAARTISSPDPTAAGLAGQPSARSSKRASSNGFEPYAYLKDVLERMVDGFPANRVAELMPWAWKAYATTSG